MQATEKLRDERLSAQCAALFATLAPTRYQHTVVRLTVAFEVLFDLLDALGETPAADRLANNLRLHRALLAAVDPTAACGDFLRDHPTSGDGGYVDALVDVCRRSLANLPSAAAVQPIALEAAERSRYGQSTLHACEGGSIAPLLDWASKQRHGGEWLACEYAAATISPLALHALFAAAADPSTTREDAVLIDAAYYPAVCALTILFDSVIDAPRDIGTANHSFLTHYPSTDAASVRVADIAQYSQKTVRGLRHGRSHGVLVAGIVAFYLSAPTACTELGRPYATKVLAGADPLTRPMLAALRAQRRAGARI